MNVVAIVYNYPHQSRPYSGIFVKNFLRQLKTSGCRITVVAPQRLLFDNRMSFYTTEEGIEVYRPTYLSLGSFRFGRVKMDVVTQALFDKAVFKTLSENEIPCDVIYSHFLKPSGLAALNTAERLGVESICVLGESDLLMYEQVEMKLHLKSVYEKFSHLVCNSLATRNLLVNHYAIPGSHITAIPNGINREIFHPRDKRACRKHLGLNEDEVLAIFVGSFIERKGPDRVVDAIESLEENVKLIMIGAGALDQSARQSVVFSGLVSHEKLAHFLCAADVFVLPTLSEGMPNAVIEAMACNLPVVTSTIEPNLELLGENYPYFCEPMNVASIAESVARAISAGPIEYSTVPSIEDRASKVLSIFKGIKT